MRKINFFLFFASIIILITACSKKEQSIVVTLEPTQTGKPSIGKVSKIIPLEKTEISLLGFIDKVFIDKNNNRIFILSEFNFFIFDAHGKFVTKLSNGKGPGEVNMVISFSADTSNQIIQVLDLGNIILKYDYNGQFISKTSLNSFSSFDLQVIDNKFDFLLSNYVGKSVKKFVGLYNINTNEVIKRFIPAEESPYPLSSIVTRKNFTKYRNRQFFYSPNIFALFEYKDTTFRKVIEFDLGSKKIPDNIIATFKDNRRNFNHEELQKNYIPFLNYIFYFNEYYMVVAGDPEKSCFAINENDFKEVYRLKQLSSYFNLPEVNSLKHPCGFNNNYLILSCSPVDLFENDPTSKSKKTSIGAQIIDINIDDNPFLILVE